MSRKIRYWFPGAIYHVTARGNRHSPIFLSPLDYRNYLSNLQKVKEKYPFLLHAYCLMTNHVHLQIETIDHTLSDIIKLAHTRYAAYFNRFHDLDGHVFQGRYGSKLILDDHYFLEVSRYIHRNPLEAKMVNAPQEYEWSSYPSYINGTVNPFIDKTKTLSHFSNLTAYRNFVEK
jgi:putative transposase